jgi:carboxypeptidase Taq
MPHEVLEQLKARLGEVIDLNAATALMHWDQEVCMPPKAAAARGRQLATVSALAHRLHTAPEVGEWLARLQDDPALSGDDAALVAEAAYDHARATCLPESFVETFAQEQSRAYEAWVAARRESRFEGFQPHLEKLIALSRQRADYLGYADTPYDALLEDHERGMTAAQLRVIFGELATRQSGLLKRIMAAPAHADFPWLEQTWDADIQWDFTMEVLRDIGYDFDAGRQDKSVHPFTTNFDLYDVRITTRVDPEDLFSALTGSIHEGGHALYEQGFLARDQRTVLAAAPSLGIHESQSRLWENLIGRSLPFWEHYGPRLARAHVGKLDGVSPEDLHRAINRVRPSLIRVEADECSYNLHVILRFEIEMALFDGSLAAADLPEAWNAKVREYLGLEVPDDARGCLQDIHWSHGSFGYFPTYALGNLYSAQLLEKIEADVPSLWADVGRGNFAPLLAWLRRHVHEIGRRKATSDIVREATGQEPGSGAFLRYLERKYGALYGI